MEGRATLLRGHRTGAQAPAWICRLLVVVAVLVVMLLPAPPAEAQQPQIAISETVWEFRDRDATREYWEIANLGTTAWNPNNHWLFRSRFREDNASDNPQLFVRIQGVDPVPPGGVLQIEWGRPLEEDNADTDTKCNPGPNVFCTGREGFNSTDLDQNMGLGVFGPTANNEAPTLENGTMLAFYWQGELNAPEVDLDVAGYKKAVASKLWKDGDVARPSACDWAHALRMGRGPYPADHGRKAADYYTTLVGIATLDNIGFGLVGPPAPAPTTRNRAGTIAQPNYLHPGLPIPGQVATGFQSVQARVVAASLAQNAPPAGLQVVGLNPTGNAVTSLLANDVWSPMAAINGAPVADGLTLVNNPTRASRTLILRAKADGALSAMVSNASEATFGAPAALDVKAQFAPAAVVDAAGNEHYLAVEAGTGNIIHNVNENGKLRGWQPIAGAKTDAPVAAVFTSDPAGLSVAAFNGNQLVINRLGADGKFGAWVNVGAALSERPAGIGPTMAWNTSQKRLELVVLSGPADKADAQHARVELTSLGEAKVGALAKINGIGTNAAPAIAVSEPGQIRLLARSGGHDPGPNPREEEDLTAAYGDSFVPDPGDPQSGFVFGSTFDGTNWSAPVRVGVARLPGVTAATPMFAAPVAPATLYDPLTRRFQDFLIGEDGQIYHNPQP